MARRASSSAHPVWIVVALILATGAIAGGYFLFNRVSDPYRTMTVLPVNDYLENSNSLRGNTYKLDATISQSLEWSATGGRLFSVEVGADVLPILVPASFNHFNLERGQRYYFKIQVGDKGILTAQDVKKV
jgi:hypothetical protein